MKTKVTALTLLLLTVFLGSALVVFAQEDTTQPKITPQDKPVTSCSDTLLSFDKKAEKFLLSEPTYTYKYQVLWLKTAEIARKADVMGYDTTAIYDNLDELDKLTKEYSNNFDDFITKLATARKYLCPSNEKLYVSSIQKAENSLSKVRESTQNISDLYQNEIRPNLLSLDKTGEENQNE